MRDEEVFVMFVVFSFLALSVWIGTRAKYRSQRLKVIERALEKGTLDEASRRALLQALSDAPASEWMKGLGQHLAFLGRNILFIGGWVALFVGIGMVLVAWVSGRSYNLEAGVITAVSGFALATVPLALRELDSKRERQRS